MAREAGLALAHEMLAHPGLRLFTGVPAVTLAGQLAPYRMLRSDGNIA